MAGCTDLNLLQGANIDTVLQIPDFTKLKQERLQRNHTVLKRLDANEHEKPELTNCIIQNEAAKQIQRLFRGHLGRKRYLELLYENVLTGEEDFYKQQQQQVQEGEILIENYKIERELEETDSVSHNKTRLAHTNAAIIQRAWRQHRNATPKEHICCACNDNYPDLYEYYSKTQAICFCCEQHRLMTNEERMSLLTLDEEEFVFDDDDTPEITGILPSSSVDWLSISSVLNSKTQSGIVNMEDYRNKVEVNSDDLTFVDSCDKIVDSNNNVEAEVFYTTVGSDCVDINIEKVINFTLKKNPYFSEPVEELTHNLKSLEIHQEHEVLQKSIERKTRTESQQFIFSDKTVDELKDGVQNLQNDIAEKNLELLKELMVRDDLYTQHEALLMNVDSMAKKLKSK